MSTSDPNVVKACGFDCQKFIWYILTKLAEGGKTNIQLEDVKNVLQEEGWKIDRPEVIIAPQEGVGTDNSIPNLFDTTLIDDSFFDAI
jgi:hypothetical protein